MRKNTITPERQRDYSRSAERRAAKAATLQRKQQRNAKRAIQDSHPIRGTR